LERAVAATPAPLVEPEPAEGAGRGPGEASDGEAAAGAGAVSEGETSKSKAAPERSAPPADVFVVEDRAQAGRVAALLQHLQGEGGRVFACDTEVAEINVLSESPVGHGRLVCFSIFCGDDVHFGLGTPNGVRQNKLWVDVLEQGDERAAIMESFRPFFEDPGVMKVWHNYGFDRHILENEGVRLKGFWGDSMHMARLWDSSRQSKGYALSSLTSDPDVMGVPRSELRGKTSMKQLFGKPNIKKDGTPGKLVVLPPVEEIQTDPETYGKWVDYSAYDAEVTWKLAVELERKLKEMRCHGDGVDPLLAATLPTTGLGGSFSMWDFYTNYWRPFGELLTDMEQEGVLVDNEHLAAMEEVAKKDQESKENIFRSWAAQYVPDAAFMNVGSGPQIRQLLFAGVPNQKPDLGDLEVSRTFKIPNTTGHIEPGREGKPPLKNRNIELFSVFGREEPTRFGVDVYTPSGWPAVSTPVLRTLAGKPGTAQKALDTSPSASLDPEDESDNDDVHSLRYESDDANPLDELPIAASYSAEAALEEQIAQGYGKAYSAFGGGHAGLSACAAIDALCDMAAIDTLLSNFILPLQGGEIKGPKGRVHCSMNINTETGRLSARRPNLQNQPALEKDRYKIRKAFTAEAGKTLIVADYGQLELRLLAHMANCESMLKAFRLGGDFHSRTALGMYDHIQAAVEHGDCLLEWDSSDGERPAPLIKDMYASERRKAKVLNFSIAYGKTAHGLAKDWKVDIGEAQETLERWYSDRPEVQTWQAERRAELHETKRVRTLLGRTRHLPNVDSRNSALRYHCERAAINTPIQGGAADIATLAMLELDRCEELRDLGWKLLLQVHDEVILEGPQETVDEGLALVRRCMEFPFAGTNPLKVELAVDANSATTWYEAK